MKILKCWDTQARFFLQNACNFVWWVFVCLIHYWCSPVPCLSWHFHFYSLTLQTWQDFHRMCQECHEHHHQCQQWCQQRYLHTWICQYMTPRWHRIRPATLCTGNHRRFPIHFTRGFEFHRWSLRNNSWQWIIVTIIWSAPQQQQQQQIFEHRILKIVRKFDKKYLSILITPSAG